MSHQFDGLFLLAVLGLVTGLVAGGLVIGFRLVLEYGTSALIASQSHTNTDIGPDAFELLNGWQRFLLCSFGGLVVGGLLYFLKPKERHTGVVHVIERLDYHQGRLPLKNAIVQFIGACIALMSGQSMGREGPSIHLGATSGSLLGRFLRVPNNSLRILVGCGVAAAVAAAFNTPLAGVILAMEVIIMEYTVIGFTPVILSAVSATAMSRLVFGNTAALVVPTVAFDSLTQLPLIALMGVAVGCISALFIQLALTTNLVLSKQGIWLKCLLAGILTGLLALAVPQIMGVGYDSLNSMLAAQLGLGLLIALLLAKLVATSFAVGVGMPAGLIGPTLFIGASAGGVVGTLAALVGNDPGLTGFYSMLGMAAMMAATLQAPLAALICLLELTAYQGILLPGMVAVVSASLISRAVFGKSSIYRHLMLARGLDYRNSALSIALRKIGVASVMDRKVIQHDRFISAETAAAKLLEEPRWLLIKNDDHSKSFLLPATDLARFINELDHTDQGMTEIDLLGIPAMRHDAASTTIIATLQEAYETMQAEQCDILCVRGAHGTAKTRIYGVISREHIERSYQV